MPHTPPTTGPGWATASTAVVQTPTPLQWVAGFVVEQVLAADFLNGILNNFGSWISYLNGPRAPYATLEGAETAMQRGDTVTIFENDTATIPGDLLAGYRTSGSVYSRIAATSDVIVVIDNQAAPAVTVFSRSSPGGTAVRTITLSHAGFAHALSIYGDILAVAYGTYVELFTLSTGISMWSFDHGGNVLDAQVSGQYTVICGAAGTGAYEARIRRTSDGAAHDDMTHGATLYACAIYGRNVAVAGDAGTGGNNVRAYQIGLLGFVVSLWDDVAGTGGKFFTLRTDGRVLYGTESGHAYVLSWADGSQISDQNINGGVVATSQWMAVDQGGVYVCSTDGTNTQLQRLALGTCSFIWQALNVVGAEVAVATDGARIWALATTGGSAARILTYARGNVAGQWTKINTTVTTYNRWPWLLVPGVE